MTPSASCLAPTVLRNGARPRAGRRELRWASARPAADATAPPMRLLVVHDSARVVERCMAERSPHDGGHHHQSVSRYTCNADPGRLAESRHSSSPSPLPVQRAPSTRQPRGHTVQYILYIQYSTRSGRVASPASASAGCPVVYKRRVAAPLAAQRDWPPRVGGGGATTHPRRWRVVCPTTWPPDAPPRLCLLLSVSDKVNLLLPQPDTPVTHVT